MILDTVDRYGGVEKAELRVKRSAKKAEKKQEATMLRPTSLRFIASSVVSHLRIQK